MKPTIAPTRMIIIGSSSDVSALDGRGDLVLVEVGDLREHRRRARRSPRRRRPSGRPSPGTPARLRSGAAIVPPRLTEAVTSSIALLDDRVAGRLAGDLDRLEDRHAGGDERRQRARPARERDLLHDGADLERDLQAQAVPLRTAPRRSLPAAEARRRPPTVTPISRYHCLVHEVRHADRELRDRRQLAAEVLEDLREDGHEERDHREQDDPREAEDDRRVDHRRLHLAAQRVVLLELVGDAQQRLVEPPAALARRRPSRRRAG